LCTFFAKVPPKPHIVSVDFLNLTAGKNLLEKIEGVGLEMGCRTAKLRERLSKQTIEERVWEELSFWKAGQLVGKTLDSRRKGRWFFKWGQRKARIGKLSIHTIRFLIATLAHGHSHLG